MSNRPLLEVGTLKQKANWFLASFVFGCIFIIILLLYAMVKAEAKGEELNSIAKNNEYSLGF